MARRLLDRRQARRKRRRGCVARCWPTAGQREWAVSAILRTDASEGLQVKTDDWYRGRLVIGVCTDERASRELSIRGSTLESCRVEEGFYRTWQVRLQMARIEDDLVWRTASRALVQHLIQMGVWALRAVLVGLPRPRIR